MKTYTTPHIIEETQEIPCALCGTAKFRVYLKCDGYTYVKCNNCALVQQNPQPVQAAVSLRYNNESGRDYLKYELENEAAYLELATKALSDADFEDSGGRLLDIGCATGAMLEKLRRGGWDVYGCEINQSQAEYARQKRGLEISCATLEESRYPDGFFRAVLASHLIEHLNRPMEFLREVNRILENGGNFYVTTPNIAGFQARIFGSEWRSAINDHLYLFSGRTLCRMLDKAGFTVRKIRTWGGLAKGLAPAPVKALADKMAKALGWGDVMIVKAQKRGTLKTFSSF
jgi:2-polyprenyl-3-methyl-5-hydroxy-6-metoxy-1,4-benzoquinol methylase